MEKPAINFKIQSPSMDSPVPGESGACGASWYSQVEVRSPYKNVDNYVSVLPIIQEAGVFPTKSSDDFKSTVPDLTKAMPELVKVPFHNNLWDGILGAQELLDNYSESGHIDDKNMSSIQSMIDLAREYYNAAKSLIAYFIKTSPKVDPSQWPEEDQLLIFRLFKASIKNARCAQEASCAVGIYNQNKAAYQSLPRAHVQRAKPKRAAPILSGPAPEESESVPSAIEEAPRRKKKENNILLLGAAALGLLMLKGK